MNQDENTESIKETFNVSYESREILPAKANSKFKIAIAIISTILILAATTTLLIGYFKFDWFKKEIYKVDANITHELNKANFFSETKKINTKIALTKDEYEEQEYLVNTDFMVLIKEKTQLKENDNLYKSSIVILKSKMTTKDGEYELPAFDIQDEKQVKEFETSQDGSKYPIAEFSFFENGTISDIKFPDVIDEYNTQTLKGLIENVIPKLTRNRTEDYNNGLNLKTRTNRKKKTLIEEEKPKQYYDFKGSKFSKTTERDFEDDKLTDIRTKSDIHLQSNPDEDEQTFGAKDFYFKSESNIISYEFGPWLTAYSDKPLPPGVAYCLPTIYSLNQNFDISKAIQTNRTKLMKGAMTEIDTTVIIPGILETDKPRLRNLGYSISADRTFDIGKYDVLGQTVTVKYHVGVKNGNPINELIISSKLGKTTIGNTGVSLKGSWSRTVKIFTFAFPAFPLVSLNAHVYGSISWGVSVTSGSGKSVKLSASLGGTLSLGCEVKAGWDPVISFTGGVEGVIVSASGSATIQNGSVTKNFSINAGRIYVYLDRSILGNKKRVAEKTLFAGW